MDGAVRHRGRRRVGGRLGQIADDRVGAALLDVRGSLAIPHERIHMMSGANERLEHRRPQVSRSAGQKDPHDQKPRLPIQCVYARSVKWEMGEGQWAIAHCR